MTESVEELTEEFNKYFSSVFTVEDNDNIPKAAELINNNSGGSLLSDFDITEEMVMNKLLKLRSDKAPGADELSPRLLLEVAQEVCHPLTLLMRKSFKTGQVPDDWKKANVSPIFKKGSKGKAENYRPVSLTSQLCKIFESLMRDVIVNHLEKNLLIKDSQHGFRKGRSCLSNLLVFLDKVTRSMDEGENVDVIFLDFAKAFDKVPHKRLAAKLEAHGITGRVKDWIVEWLRDRWQRVCVQGKGSGWRRVTSGVPQGSVLGPVLFLIFINDLDEGISNWILKFADDTKIFGAVNGLADAMQLQVDLSRLMQWAREWQMQFNVGKCKIMHFGHGNSKFKYFMDNKELESVSTEKDLGVLLSEDLKASNQCVQSYARASRMLGMINRTITCKSQQTLLQLYKTLVRPHLEYCTVVWSPHYKKDKDLLEKVQHRLTRMIPGLRCKEYAERLRILGLWTLEERRNRADLIEVFKMWKGQSAVNFENFFEPDTNSRTRGHSLKLRKHHCRLDLRHHFYSERVINKWNSLDQQTIDSTTLNNFKQNLTRLRNRQKDLFMDSSPLGLDGRASEGSSSLSGRPTR